MTADEVRDKINSRDKFESIMYVDAETYANCCQYVFDQIAGVQFTSFIILSLGINHGLMFKGIELILELKK